MRRPSTNKIESAKISKPLLSLFLGYIHRLLGKHFHAVRLSLGGHPPRIEEDRPLVVYLNHASWWDPLLMMWLGKQCYPGRAQYGPIEAEQLKRYGFFKYLGVFGAERGTVSGARNFLRVSGSILAQRGTMLWMTPQGRFADIRERPLSFAPGLSHLCKHQANTVFVPLAVEYAFGQERLPEIFVHFGDPVDGLHLGSDAKIVQEALESALLQAADALSASVCARDVRCFKTILEGMGGASLPYDLWRRLRAFVKGESVEINHGSQK